MKYPASLKYTKHHEWVKVDGNLATIGITEYAQGELGDIVFVDIDPEISEIVSGESFGTIEAVKTVSDLFLPVAGTVTEVNPLLEKQPELVNTDAYGDGWMVKMTVSNPADVAALMSSEAYAALVG